MGLFMQIKLCSLQATDVIFKSKKQKKTKKYHLSALPGKGHKVMYIHVLNLKMNYVFSISHFSHFIFTNTQVTILQDKRLANIYVLIFL